MDKGIKLSWWYRRTHSMDTLVSDAVARFGHINEIEDQERLRQFECSGRKYRYWYRKGVWPIYMHDIETHIV